MDGYGFDMDVGNILTKSEACILDVTQREPNLTGSGVIIAVIDSGIDYKLPEFINSEGKTRLIGIWDQSVTSDPENGLLPPNGFKEGVYYTRDQIDQALQSNDSSVTTVDVSGHGTAVTAIAAGSISGVATQSEILVIKLGNPSENGFPRTTQLMRAITFAVNTGISLNKAVVINLSFGNTYGDHRGDSLLERFIDNASEIGRNVIVVGSGNEAASNGHTAGIATERKSIELVVAPYQAGLSVQYWKYYNDIVQLRIVSPGGSVLMLNLENVNIIRATLEDTELLCYIGEPLPYSVNQEIYIDMIPDSSVRFIKEGVWTFEIIPQSVVTGEYRFYLPSYVVRNRGTGFVQPTPAVTLTIPSTANRAITVGAYNSFTRSYADFSGRGYVYRYTESAANNTVNSIGVAYNKPDIVAPGVDITVPLVGGGYEKVSGTSFATPFVSGSAALMMEYGIVRENDIYMYGQKLKSFLIKGARKLPGYENWPNEKLGWGSLCLKGSI